MNNNDPGFLYQGNQIVYNNQFMFYDQFRLNPQQTIDVNNRQFGHNSIQTSKYQNHTHRLNHFYPPQHLPNNQIGNNIYRDELRQNPFQNSLTGNYFGTLESCILSKKVFDQNYNQNCTQLILSNKYFQKFYSAQFWFD